MATRVEKISAAVTRLATEDLNPRQKAGVFSNLVGQLKLLVAGDEDLELVLEAVEPIQDQFKPELQEQLNTLRGLEPTGDGADEGREEVELVVESAKTPAETPTVAPTPKAPKEWKAKGKRPDNTSGRQQILKVLLDNYPIPMKAGEIQKGLDERGWGKDRMKYPASHLAAFKASCQLNHNEEGYYSINPRFLNKIRETFGATEPAMA